MQAVECGYGHRIIDGDTVMYTSQEAIIADLDSLCDMLNKSVEMLSELINVKPEYIMEDLYEMCGCNLWGEAIKAVLAKKGVKYYLPTLTEEHFDVARRNKREVQPVKHGQWLKRMSTPDSLKCSVCGNNHEYETAYCPHCGRKMYSDAEGRYEK